MSDFKTAQSVLPFVWPCLPPEPERLSEDCFTQIVEDARALIGITSSVDRHGARLLIKLLGSQPKIEARIIVAVFGGCPTRERDLSNLLDFSKKASEGTEKPRVQFRILPMEDETGRPAECLVAVAKHDTAPPVFLFGPTSNFGVGPSDRTQINMGFKADPVLFDQWRRWFDKTWQKAAKLTEATVNIPALSPARGSLEAAALWEGYCNVCAETDRIESLDHDPDTGEIRISQEPDGEEESPPTIDLKLPKLDRMADRISRLFSAGQQVAIAHSSAVGPLETPVDPQFFKQQAERRIGTVVQRQSFRISVFSKDELKRLDGYRLGSQNIIKKLALSYGKNLYWLPDEMISILEKEVETKNSEAEADLKELVGGSAGCFVKNKIKEIERDLTNIYRELGGKDDLPPRALTKVVRDLELRISKALGSRLLAPITCSRITIPAPADSGWQAPWAQAKELVFSLAKFPRRVIVRPNELSELCTSQEEILGAMNIQNDAILKVESHWERQDRARSQLRELEWIEYANIGDRDRCEAVFMLIDGPQHYDVL